MQQQSVKQRLLIIHGGPGVGKSTFARALWHRLKHYDYDMLCCAPTGMAASLLINGKTIHKLLAIGVNKGGKETIQKMEACPCSEMTNYFPCRTSFANV